MRTIQDKAAEKAMAPTENKAHASQNVAVLMNTMLDSEKMRARFDELLGKRAPQFISSLISMVNGDKNLEKAFIESPMTVIQAGLKAATFDLPIDPNLGYAYIMPFNNRKRTDSGAWVSKMEATFVIGWKGMNQLALRTGAYSVINVVDVREGELKKYNRLTEEIDIEFVEDEEVREALPVVGYVGYYRLINGASKTIYMSKKQIESHEAKFRKGENMGKGWRDNWDDMARKTVYRRLIGKYGIMSIDYQSPAAASETAKVMTEEFVDAVTTADTIPADYEEISINETTGEVEE